MRLSIEQAKKYLQGMHRLWLCDEWEQPYDSERCRGCDSHDNCLDIVLASESMSDIAQDLYDTIEALQQENEQLRAKLGDWKYEVQCHMDEVTARDKENEQLRAQVTTLKNIKEMLHECMAVRMMPDKVERVVNDALAEIDKAIGGGQDGSTTSGTP